jgi:hypothetical protein
VSIKPTARVKLIRKHIEEILKKLEERGRYSVRVDSELKSCAPELFYEIADLGITVAACYRPEGNGKVDLLAMPGTGGPVDERGSTIPSWAGEFLRAPCREDVLSKLERSGAKDRHAFLIVTFGGAPFSVWSYLVGKLDPLPSQAPDLPSPVTQAWVVSTMGQRGLRWDGCSWQQFDALVLGIEEER